MREIITNPQESTLLRLSESTANKVERSGFQLAVTVVPLQCVTKIFDRNMGVALSSLNECSVTFAHYHLVCWMVLIMCQV